MKNTLKYLISIILIICLSVGSVAIVSADEAEVYISELRLIYADDYKEAQEILKETEFNDYKILNYNLNSKTGKKGVWLAYKTSTDIEDAITDIAVMQMDGGYNIGNYQEMIEKSKEGYIEMGEIYMKAIEYFKAACEADSFIAKTALRQLNFYTGVDNHEGEKLGDIFAEGNINASELATIFMQGNTYALKNIRSLLAMGVAYNEDGKHYLEKVEEEAAAMENNPDIYEDEDFTELAILISPAIPVFAKMFEELAAYEDEMNFDDDIVTEKEVDFAEHMAIAEMMREVQYLDGKTLYEFCLEYSAEDEDYESLYPLAAALNEGQVAMTKVAHYFDVVRYSMSSLPESFIEEELTKMEAEYGDNPFNIYAGVDRSIYEGSFALTNEAYRAEAYTKEGGLWTALFGEQGIGSTGLHIAAAVLSVGIATWARILRKGAADKPGAESIVGDVAQRATALKTEAANRVGSETLANFTLNGETGTHTYEKILNDLLERNLTYESYDFTTQLSFMGKVNYMKNRIADGTVKVSESDQGLVQMMDIKVQKASDSAAGEYADAAAQGAKKSMSVNIGLVTSIMYIVSGALMLYAAIDTILDIYNYYNPTYKDIPVAMVDMMSTVDGDRYIKYDVVYEATPQEDGEYTAGDLNAFAGQRWNALYYTKSYEAGKPLLANFKLSYDNNEADKNYQPVHRFGEGNCYNLNKYNFESKADSIYLSAKQSENQKAAVADVPAVVGAMIGKGYYFLIGGAGALVGAGAMFMINHIQKKKKFA